MIKIIPKKHTLKKLNKCLDLIWSKRKEIVADANPFDYPYYLGYAKHCNSFSSDLVDCIQYSVSLLSKFKTKKQFVDSVFKDSSMPFTEICKIKYE